MRTFTGEYSGNNYILSDDNAVLKMQLVSILNTPLGSRYYYPSYGSNLNSFKFAPLNYFTINMIGQEVKNAIELIDGVTLTNISYYTNNNTITFNINLNKDSNNTSINLAIADGVAF